MLREQYPRAVARLEAAAEAKLASTTVWNRALDQGLFFPSVHLESATTGVVRVSADWNPADRDAFTGHLRDFVTALWGALDELVAETVDMFAVLRAPRDPTAERYFPIADSRDAFESLLAAGCIDGVLRRHAAIITACQEFARGDDATGITVRRGLSRLLAWSRQLDDGMQISAWATPVDPQVSVSPPATVVSVQLQPPSEVTPSGAAVARFTLDNHQPGQPLHAQPNTYLDPYWPGDEPPADDTDHFPGRVDGCFDAVLQIAGQFAATSGRVPGARTLLAPQPASSHVSTARPMTAAEAAALLASDSKVATVVDDTGIRSIVVATPEGILQREIPPSSTLRAYQRDGDAAETAVRDAVATWGLPDFAMRPAVERKGAGVREISDGVVLAGNRGLILQVKRREHPGSDRDKEHRWVGKQIEKASKQVDGSYRRLRSAPAELVNGRGTTLRIDTPIVQWIGVVIIDHPDNSLHSPIPPCTTRIPTVVLSRRDWEFLFNQLRSTRAVIDYLFRVETSADRLHDETGRYFEHAVLDAAAPPEPPSTLHAGLGDLRSTPQLPINSTGAADPSGSGMFRLICEDIATMPSGDVTDEQLLEILAMLDGLHVSLRADLGRRLLDALKVPSTSNGHPWQFRTFLPTVAGGPQLAFGTCAKYDESVLAAFRAWAELRHQERGDREDISDATTIGVLLTPRTDGRRDWDTTLLVLRGDLETPEDVLERYRTLWGRRGPTT